MREWVDSWMGVVCVFQYYYALFEYIVYHREVDDECEADVRNFGPSI